MMGERCFGEWYTIMLFSTQRIMIRLDYEVLVLI